MSSIPVEELLNEIAADEPSGPNMEYDAAYLAIDRIAQGKPERQMGDQILAAEDPDWRRLQEEAQSLLKKSKDLRICVYLTVAAMKLEGLPGLSDGLAVLHGLLDRFWETVYPQLDPDDDNDPTERVNIIDSLAQPPTMDDPMGIQRRLQEVYLCDSKQVGRFGIRDIHIATGEIATTADPDSPPADMATIEAAFMDTEVETLTANAEAVSASIQHAKDIEALLTDKVGAGNAADLSSFIKVLTSIQSVLSEYLAKRGAAVPDAVEADSEQGSDGGGGSPAPGLSGEVRSRQEVLNAIDKIFRYYETQEPSSPVPVVLKRARRLVTMNFMEIITDLSPDAITQIQMISGVDNEASEG